jgi:predicted dehydrogenase
MNTHPFAPPPTPTPETAAVPRRRFLQTMAAGAAAGLAVRPLSAADPRRMVGANNRVRVAVVGIRGMGYGHIRSYAALKDVEVAALCDVDENLFAERIGWLEKAGHRKPKTYVDLRRLLEDREIDAISVATPNHWHALAGVWAAQAGKHSTLEKPGTHNFFEGKKLIEAARKYNVLIQHHAERRSYQGFKDAIAFLHGGGLGEVYLAKGLCYKRRETIGRTPVGPVPAGVHYDLWLGPAPKRPFTKNRFHYNWHWHWDYGNGDLGNQGAHQMDIARWGLGGAYPTKISSLGGRFMFDDDQETANTQMALYEFPAPQGGGDRKKMLQFEVRHWYSNDEADLGPGDNTIGNIFYGAKGYLTLSLNGEWKTYLGKNREPGPSGRGSGNMYENFVQTIRSGNPAMLEGDMAEGHLSCALIHFANISYRLGRTLDFDPKAERFVGDAEANAMLTREYRAPFVVPEKV